VAAKGAGSYHGLPTYMFLRNRDVNGVG
jgi:hypothetical protein